MTTESKRLKEEAKKFGVTVQNYTMATLMAAGWTAAESYALAYYSDATLAAARKATNRDNIVQNPNFIAMVEKLRASFPSAKTVVGGIVPTSLPSKDEVAQIIAAEMNTLSGKEKVDAAMKLADLFAMKKEEIKDDEDIVRVWLPLTCSICPYKQRAEEADKEARNRE